MVTEKKTALSLGRHEKAMITEIKDGPLTARLLAMGIIPHATCVLLQKAPFGGAWILGLEQHQIAMREEELAYIFVDLIEEGKP